MNDKTEEEKKETTLSPIKKVAFHEKEGHYEHSEEDSQYGSINAKDEALHHELKVDVSNNNNITLIRSSNVSNMQLPFVCLSDGMARKASPFALSSWVALSLTLDGRDKITKTIQYACRLISWWYANILSSSKRAAPYTNLYKTLANSRKAFRLGRFLVEYYKLKQNFPQLLSYTRHSSIPPSCTGGTLLWRMLDNLYSCFDDNGKQLSASTTTVNTPMWSTIGLSCKMIAMAGFWFGDNLTYLASSGFLPTKELYTSKAQFFSSRSYFIGALIGLCVGLKEIQAHQPILLDASKRVHDLILQEEEEEEKSNETCSCPKVQSHQWKEASNALSEARSQQFILFLALLKSTCDTMAFSNNPGVDLHLRFRGKKMNEGFHCLCGLLSAGTVLYNNFPNNKQRVIQDVSLAQPKAAFLRSASSNWYSSPSPFL